MAVGDSATGTFVTPTDSDWGAVRMVNGTTYQIDVRSVGYPGIDPWIIDIYDQVGRITRPAGMFGASYAGFFDHDSGPGNAARVIYTATKTEDHYIVFGTPVILAAPTATTTMSRAGRAIIGATAATGKPVTASSWTGTPATVTGSESSSPIIGPTSCNWRAAGRIC